jgi:DNA gyrase subunit B
MAFLNKGLKISLKMKEMIKRLFSFEGGISEFVSYLNRAKNAVHKKPVISFILEMIMKLKLLCNGQMVIQKLLTGYANNINTPGGGTHVSGFKTALTRVLNNYAKEIILKKKVNSI